VAAAAVAATAPEAAAVVVPVKFTPYAARDKQLSAHFHALVNRNKRSVSAKSRGLERPPTPSYAAWQDN